MKYPVKKVGIMGGTFDPIHYGHLVTAEAVRAEFELDEVVFVPTGNPPHKLNQKVSDKNHRYLMTLLATATNPYFEISTVEIDREGYTYTIDTVKNFSKIYNEETTFHFITGADALNQILTWKDPDILLSKCEFIAATRPGYRYEQISGDIKYLTDKYKAKIHFIEVPSLAISSTDIRYRIKNNKPIKYLLPESVETYINKNRLYR